MAIAKETDMITPEQKKQYKFIEAVFEDTDIYFKLVHTSEGFAINVKGAKVSDLQAFENYLQYHNFYDWNPLHKQGRKLFTTGFMTYESKTGKVFPCLRLEFKTIKKGEN